MKLERISALIQALPLQGRAQQHRPAPGESLLLTYGEAADAEAMATLSNGAILRLTGLGQWQNRLRPGDTLRVRVIANEPTLELEVESGPAPKNARASTAEDDGPANMTRHAAMRLDQAALRKMTWEAPNPAALAKSWHDLALERWGTQLSRQSNVSSVTTMIGPPPYREPPGNFVLNSDPLLLPVYAWGGVQLLLRLPYAARHERKHRERHRHELSLRLELAPPALGPVVLDVQWSIDGVDLTITIHRAHAEKLVRQALPKIGHTLSAAAVPLHDLRVIRDGAVIARLDLATLNNQAVQLPPRSLLALFRALAETAVVLLQVVP
jgi:hypothetical protein